MNRREFIKALMIGYMYNLIVPSTARSKDAFIKYGDMDLIHFIRSHIKDSKRVWDDMSDKTDKLAEINTVQEYWGVEN